jgi:hypothetical protein
MCGLSLETSNGDYFSLKVLSYTYPDEYLEPNEDNPASEFDDSRFLVVKCDFTNDNLSWSQSGTILRTSDLLKLREFFSSLTTKAKGSGCYVTERDLEFTYDEMAGALVVIASWDFSPNGDCHITNTSRIKFPLTQIDLGQVIRDLDRCIKMFPGKPMPKS